MPSVFFSYSHVDEALRDQIETQLSMLKRQGVIETWHDRRVGAGQEFARAIEKHVEIDDIILILISADFIASDYCYETEMARAMERHEAGEAIVIPVILRACDWQGAPFGKLNPTPPGGKPITQYADRDQALLEVTKAVRAAVNQLKGKASHHKTPISKAFTESKSPPDLSVGPRSSNLALAKRFSEREKARFKRKTFDYIARFFENSLEELAARNAGVEGDFRRIDADRFTASVYRDGQAIARCTVFLGSHPFVGGIAYSASETSANNAFNEILTVEADEHSMFLRSMGMLTLSGHQKESRLTQEGAAELYWSELIGRLQAR